MKSRFFTIVTPLIILAVFTLGITPVSSSTPPPEYNSTELTNRLKTGVYLQKTDNLMIIVDGSGETFLGGESKSQKVAGFLVSNIGKTIPNIPHRRMLRVHGPKADKFEKDFSTVFGLYHIDAKGFTPIITTKTLADSSFDPLGMTFISATKDLRKLSGSHAVVLISDGINIPKSAVYESAYMKKKFRGSVCYYPILIGNDPQGAKNMSTIAKVGDCGFLAQYEAVDSPAELTDYVEKIFFAKRRMPVKPVEVVEPEIKADPIPVEEPLEPVMTDTAEVTEIVEEPEIPEIIEDEFAQQIPVTTDDIIILERQLPHDKVVTIELHVEFDLNKASLRPGYLEEIKKVADFMILYPETEALLEGHTCDLGSDAYNQQLSSRRANTVKNYLVKNFDIDPQRLKTRGAGETEPIADNSTEAGRMQNRRVMAVISTIVTDYITIEQEILKSDFLSDDFILPPVDQIVEEMMEQEEVVDEPQEAEVTVAPGIDQVENIEIPGASQEIVDETQPIEPTEGVMEDDVAPEVDSMVDEETSVTPSEVDQPEIVEGDVSVEEQKEAEVDAAFDLQQEPVDIPVVQPEEATATESEDAAEQEQPVAEMATPGPLEAVEDVVVVSPGESVFDEEGVSLEVEQAEPTIETVQPEQKESSPKVNQEDDSYL